MLFNFKQLHDSVKEIKKMAETISTQLDLVLQKVSNTQGVVNSAVTLLDELTAKIDQILAEGGDPTEALAKITQLNTAIDAQTQALADAVARDTPPVVEPPVG